MSGVIDPREGLSPTPDDFQKKQCLVMYPLVPFFRDQIDTQDIGVFVTLHIKPKYIKRDCQAHWG